MTAYPLMGTSDLELLLGVSPSKEDGGVCFVIQNLGNFLKGNFGLCALCALGLLDTESFFLHSIAF